MLSLYYSFELMKDLSKESKKKVEMYIKKIKQELDKY